jgi:hypothetical protein
MSKKRRQERQRYGRTPASCLNSSIKSPAQLERGERAGTMNYARDFWFLTYVMVQHSGYGYTAAPGGWVLDAQVGRLGRSSQWRDDFNDHRAHFLEAAFVRALDQPAGVQSRCSRPSCGNRLRANRDFVSKRRSVRNHGSRSICYRLGAVRGENPRSGTELLKTTACVSPVVTP